MVQMVGVHARPDGTDDQIRGANNQRGDGQLTYRHLEPQQPSQRAEHSTMLMAILAEAGHIFLIFPVEVDSYVCNGSVMVLAMARTRPTRAGGVRRRPKDRKAQIARASAEAFSALGYYGVSMETIAAR